MADKNGDKTTHLSFDENGMAPFTPAERSGFAFLMQEKPQVGKPNPYITIVIRDAVTGQTTETERIPHLTPALAF
jgi:hypothetical protein